MAQKSSTMENGSSVPQPSASILGIATTDEVLLEEHNVNLYPHRSHKATLTLTNKHIKIVRTNKPNKAKYINLDDVVGCHVLKENQKTSKRYICIFSYPMKKKMFSKAQRHRHTTTFGFSRCKRSQDNERICKIWRLAIKMIISGKKLNKNDVDELVKSDVNVDTMKRRNFLVYVNPFSGSKRADAMYRNHLKLLLAEADIDHHCFKTEYKGHAEEDVITHDLTPYDTIIIVSGDGLIHEIINGLMKRSDWAEAIRTPIGVVPGGSGNALAASIAYASYGRKKYSDVWQLLTESLFIIARSQTKEMPIMKITQQNVATPHTSHSNGDVTNNSHFYSFLNIGWGFVADVDIESEKFRAFGGARFKIGCAVRVLNLRKYKGVIQYKPAENCSFQAINDPSNDNGGYKKFDYDVAPSVMSEESITSFASGDDKRKLLNNKTNHDVTTEYPTGEWKSLDEEFIFVMPVYLSHVGYDMFAMPPAKITDSTMEPVIYLFCLRAGLSRWQLVRSLLGFEEGRQIDIGGDYVRVIPCRDVTITPSTTNSATSLDGEDRQGNYMTVDGELVPYTPIQCSVTDVKAQVLCS